MECNLYNYELFQDLSKVPSGQRQIAAFHRQLDDQLRLLKARLSGIGIDELTWQVAAGSNTVGMLLAHIAIAEAYWINVAPLGTVKPFDENFIVTGVVGIGPDDDGMPLAAGALPPSSLQSKEWSDYVLMLDKARASTKNAIASWTDDMLPLVFELQGRRISYGWVLYHITEHFCWHAGQIMQIRSLRHGRQCG
jgi:uncharacterized damage-inducible protein DinB